MKQIAGLLAAEISGSVKCHEPLSRHTSFRIGGPADLYLQPRTTAELISALTLLREKGIPYFLLGSGTNILVADSGFRGAVIRLDGDFVQFAFEGTVATSGAAVPLARLAGDACDRNLTGLEFATGIPGSVGGALFMNAGAHGQATSDILLDAEILDNTLSLHTFKAEELQLSYRTSGIYPGAIVCFARFSLSPGKREDIERKRREFMDFRRSRQPRQPNAGSIFRNPPQDAAGRLIEAAGLKGHRSGGAKISEIHANFIVNCGNATAADVLSLIELAQETVHKKFGINLALEIKVLGD
ncbi:MAG: UDP-N-acetylmuramate dehydrogenase [Clostridiales bacterium]|jgi:UDP-N-acetylmuramate dehydrogenase|nr:UDP-N-acetylmuramate dehydrogenase [Clostridiales bacterium]